MQRKPLVWKLFPVYFIITLASVLLLALYASNSLQEFYYSQVESDLEIRTKLIAKDLEQTSMPEMGAIVNKLAAISKTRVTLILPSGKVVADSESIPATMENHSDRPEFREALSGKVGIARRLSPTLHFTMVYLAVPIRQNGKITGVLRTALAATALDAAPELIYRHIFVGGLLIALFAAAASLLAVKWISDPLKRMKEAAGRFANGDFSAHVRAPNTEELASLADTLNRMAAQLDSQVRTITQQSSERQAILLSMKEGVVALDNNDRLLILNPMAQKLMGIDLNTVKGKTIQEAIRNADLQKFFEKTHKSSAPTTDEILIRPGILIQAFGTELQDTDGKKIGVLVVLNDITKTRYLENMRKEFVANVSHELKTPITSIKGFVETLHEGAINDPVKSGEFLEIISRQAERLDSIIDDLLILSRIEKQAESEEMRIELGSIKKVLQLSIENVNASADERGVKINLDCDDDISAPMNAPLLEQAITNLVDNAVKYSQGGSVIVKAERLDQEVAIRVIDTGVGIEPEHITRLFERFYRVDKARSRKMGGTGLGLAIVKHIVQAHHGRVEVESSPCKGSTFSIILPLG